MQPALAAAVLTGAAVFILVTGQQLPATVASHFGASGRADAFSSREAYLAIMLAVAVGVPGVMLLTARLLHRLGPRRLNLPHRDYWLAPERRDASIASLARRLAVLAAAIAAFLSFVHWLVVEANSREPPSLAPEWFIPGLLAFGAFTALWIALLYRRFHRPPRPEAPRRRS